MDSHSSALGAGMLLGGILFFVLMFLISVAIGAVILRWAIKLCNKMMSNDPYNEVPLPSVGRAMLLTLVIGIIQVGVSIVAGITTGLMSAAASATGANGLSTVISLASLPVGFFLNSGLLSALLPTTFNKGMVVTLCQYLVILLIFIVIGVILAVTVGSMFLTMMHK